MAVLSTVFLAAYTAAIPGLVGRPQIAPAIAVFEAVESTGFIIGPLQPIGLLAGGAALDVVQRA